MSNGEKSRQERATEYVWNYRNAMNDYHNHKENMAYAAAALTITAMLSVCMVKKDDLPIPVDGEGGGKVWLIVALCFFMGLSIGFIRWQLRRRRLAAIRVAEADRLLAVVLTDTECLSEKNLRTNWKQVEPMPFGKRAGLLVLFLLDHLFPMPWVKAGSELSATDFPQALSVRWDSEGAPNAIKHEWLVGGLVWLAFVLALVRIWQA